MHQPYNTYLALMKPIIHLNWNTIVFCCYLELFLHNCHFQSMIWRCSLTWYDRSNINPVKDFTCNFHLENNWFCFLIRDMMIWVTLHILIFSKVKFYYDLIHIAKNNQLLSVRFLKLLYNINKTKTWHWCTIVI